MDAQTARIGFIGFGNMAQAMAKGLINYAGVDKSRISACAAHATKLQANCERIGVASKMSAAEVVASSDMIVIAVKPHMVSEVLRPVASQIDSRAVISVAAGLLCDFYNNLLGAEAHHLSTIPNTPISIGKGVIACEKQHTLTAEQWGTFKGLFGKIALIEQVDGKLLNTASAIAGCGPAFAAMFIEALADGGVKNGLPRETAYKLASQMLSGTAELQLATGNHPAAMKDAVCSPGGTTIKGVAALEEAGFRNAVISAVDATLL